MPDFPYYPANDFGPAMKGLVIGALGIVHVFLAQFAIGGGLLMTYFQWLAQTGRSALARPFIDGFFKLLVLISFVLGAVTGVGMWFTTIQVSPRTIGVMVHEFHWLWATEWTFFSLEIAAGYCFYRYGPRLHDRARFILLATYSAAAWFSLFWINGILSWQLTPGDFHETGNLWAGFFNESFWPSLIFRTITSMTIAALAACVVANLVPELTRAERTELIFQAARFLLPMLLMPVLGAWYFLAIPPDSRSWVLGGNVPMTMFFSLGVVASMLIGAYAVFGLLRQHLYINGATASLLVALAFLATAGGEFVREGVRKPYTIREYLYSNSITESEVARLRETGCTTHDPYPLRDLERYPNAQVARGALVFRNLCSVCHTPSGSNGLTHLTGTWTPTQLRLNISKLQRTKPFMPPFAGTPEELEALVQWIQWQNGGRPAEWAESHDPEVISQIGEWLEEVGTESGIRLLQGVGRTSKSARPVERHVSMSSRGAAAWFSLRREPPVRAASLAAAPEGRHVGDVATRAMPPLRGWPMVSLSAFRAFTRPAVLFRRSAAGLGDMQAAERSGCIGTGGLGSPPYGLGELP